MTKFGPDCTGRSLTYSPTRPPFLFRSLTVAQRYRLRRMRSHRINTRTTPPGETIRLTVLYGISSAATTANGPVFHLDFHVGDGSQRSCEALSLICGDVMNHTPSPLAVPRSAALPRLTLLPRSSGIEYSGGLIMGKGVLHVLRIGVDARTARLTPSPYCRHVFLSVSGYGSHSVRWRVFML